MNILYSLLELLVELFGTSTQKAGAEAGTDHIQIGNGPVKYF